MMTTRPFHVDGPWELRWHSTRYFSATLHPVGQDHGDLVANQSAGSSSAYRPNGGTFYIEFDSSSDWSAEAVSLPEVPQPAAATGGSLIPQSEISASSSRESGAAPLTSAPAQADPEQAFIGVVEKYSKAYSDAPNDMLRGATRPARAKEICSILRALGASHWTGSIYQLSSNNDGKGVIELQIARNTYVRTWNNALSDISDRTLIPTESPLFERVSHLATGQTVTFSGTFISDANDCIKESSLSVSGAMREPEFIMRFSDIQPSP